MTQQRKIRNFHRLIILVSLMLSASLGSNQYGLVLNTIGTTIWLFLDDIVKLENKALVFFTNIIKGI